ncbi:hypothetical protein VTI74DRAFT_2852 [Chaetomium olivicolor]
MWCCGAWRPRASGQASRRLFVCKEPRVNESSWGVSEGQTMLTRLANSLSHKATSANEAPFREHCSFLVKKDLPATSRWLREREPMAGLDLEQTRRVEWDWHVRPRLPASCHHTARVFPSNRLLPREAGGNGEGRKSCFCVSGWAARWSNRKAEVT